MANHKSAAKRARQTIVRNERNKSARSVARTAIKALRSSIEKKDKAQAKEQLVKVQSLLDRLGQSQAMKKATAKRKTSRLASQVAAL